jgi:hypothetical protein
MKGRGEMLFLATRTVSDPYCQSECHSRGDCRDIQQTIHF